MTNTRKQKTLALLIKWGHNPNQAEQLVDKNFDAVAVCFDSAYDKPCTPAQLATRLLSW